MELIKASLMVAAGMGGGSANLQHNPTFTTNGVKHPSSGYDGFDYVTINIPIPPQPVIGSETFTSNGTYTAGQSPYQSVDAWGVVTVDVGYQTPPNVGLDRVTVVTEEWDVGDPNTPDYKLRWVTHETTPGRVGFFEQLIDTRTNQVVEEYASASFPVGELGTWIWRGFKITDPATGAWETYVQSPSGMVVRAGYGSSNYLKNAFTGDNGYTFISQT